MSTVTIPPTTVPVNAASVAAVAFSSSTAEASKDGEAAKGDEE